MKKVIFCTAIIIMAVASCTKDTVSEHYSIFRPVYRTKAEVRAGIKSGLPQPLQTPGKLVVRGNIIFLNEVDRGIHLIDLSNPAQPKNAGFIDIPGCVDIAVNGNNLYADCYRDLVTLDINDPLNAFPVQFQNEVFPNRVYDGFQPDTTKVIYTWTRTDTTVTSRFNTGFTKYYNSLNGGFAFASSASGNTPSPGTGIAGSLSRFAQLSNRLYTVSNYNLKIFNTTVTSAPVYTKMLSLPNGDIETIFPYTDKLFIGSQTGMYVYDAKDPDQPQKLSQFIHIRSCDPVFPDGDYAYVTLRGNGKCGGAANELDVIDIKNILSPKMVLGYPLKAPAGLSKDGNLLFICDGTDGVKVFDATNPAAITLVKQISGFESYDIVTLNGIAVVVATDGLYTISYSDKQNIRVTGKIGITPNQ